MVSHASSRHLLLALGAILHFYTPAALAEAGTPSPATASAKATEVFDEVWRPVQRGANVSIKRSIPSISLIAESRKVQSIVACFSLDGCRRASSHRDCDG